MVKPLRGVKTLPPESRINAGFDGVFGHSGRP
jgi:hypothetical protein